MKLEGEIVAPQHQKVLNLLEGVFFWGGLGSEGDVKGLEYLL